MKQRAVVQPLIKKAHLAEDGTRVAQAYAPIPEVPVVSLGGGGFRLTFPIARGDGVLLVFSEASLDKWLVRGGIVDPVDDRRSDLTDAIAIPGLRDFAHALEEPPDDAITLGLDGADAMLTITGEEIKAGGTAQLVRKAEFEAHVHADPASGFTGPPTVGIAGTQYLRGFVTIGVALMLALLAVAFLLGRAT